MILPCPACQARFMVPDDRITPRGIKIRCPKCRFVFIMKAQKRAVSAPEEAPPSAVAGTLGEPRPAPKKKKAPRKRLPEAEAAKLTAEELAAVEEEIVDMDELAQATEQSGTAYNPNIKAEHLQPVASAAPSVMIDDSLLTAAAAHSASWTEAPVAAQDLPRISPSAAVTDTWIDIPGRETPTQPPIPVARQVTVRSAVASGSLGSASGAIASGSMGSVSGAIASGSMGSASEAIASGSMGSASGATASGTMGATAPPAARPAAPPPADEEPWPLPSLEREPQRADAGADDSFDQVAPEDDGDTIPGDVMSPFLMPGAQVPSAAALPVAGSAPASAPAPKVLGGVLGSAIPSAPPPAMQPAAPAHFEMAYTLSAATSFSADELAELDEYEGLLVEERRALRKGHAATVLLIVGISLGALVLGALGYLGWQVLNPPKKKPPSWGYLQLGGDEHALLKRQGHSPVVVTYVTVKNASSKHKYRNVHVKAKLLSPTNEVKCQSFAPCGPRLSPEELDRLTEEDYANALRSRSRVTAYNVQLNPSQEERCQVVLFCGDAYREGTDRVQLEVDQEHSERVIE